jgi:hypothetical protein
MGAAEAEYDPWPRTSAEFAADGCKQIAGDAQVRFGRRQRHPHVRHQRDEPIDGEVVKMALVEALVGEEPSLRRKANADALGDTGKKSGYRRTNGTVKNP